MLAVDRGLCVVESEMGSSSTNSNSLQQFIRDPLLYISKWYSSGAISSQSETSRNAPAVCDSSDDNEERPEAASTQQFRLHKNAESCLSSLKAGTASIVLQQNAEEGIHFLNLPVGVHLHIFSFLDARSLCQLSQTCCYMQSLAADPLLWSRLLQRDVHSWRVVGHLSHPKVYEEASSDFTPKQIYCNCCLHRTTLPHHSFTYPLTHRLRSLVQRIQGHIPRVLMFGSGLESVPLVRTLMWEEASPYRAIGMYPGKDGIGSGVCVQHRNSPVNLITLYTATRAERRAAANGQAVRVNKLVSAYSGDADEEPELTQAVHELCQQADAFVLAVDACKLEREALELDQTMLRAMLYSGAQRTALLVLACQVAPTSQGPVLSPAQVAEKLDLCQLAHPWQVRSLVLETYEGIQEGFDWLLGTCNS